MMFWDDLVLVSYATEGHYSREMERLEASILHFGVPYYLGRVGKFKNWMEAVRYKPFFLAQMARMFSDRPVLFVDADAILVQDPRQYVPTSWQDDPPPLTVHKMRGNRMSGTVVMNTLRCLPVLEEWAEKDLDKGPVSQPQSILRDIEGVDDSLDPAWCWIFDISEWHYTREALAGTEGKPIIEHLQASRDFRDDRKSSPRLIHSRREKLKMLGEQYD